jgi:transketolase
MRNRFVEGLVALAEHDERVVLLTGDLGFTVVDPFAERFPDRFFNAGVAEQNMVGMSVGLGEAGYIPFLYSIATFASMRAYELFRDGPVLAGLPVRLVGVGAGTSYGFNGPTHFALEDVALMRVQPSLTVVVPADPDHAAAAVSATAALDGPVYFRLSKRAESLGDLQPFRLGALALNEPGTDALVVGLGSIAGEAVAAAESLRARGVGAGVAIVSTFNPGPDDELAEALARVPLCVTVEDHFVNGGLGSYVCELVAERDLRCRVRRVGFRSIPTDVGSEAFLHREHGLDAAAVEALVASERGVRS